MGSSRQPWNPQPLIQMQNEGRAKVSLSCTPCPSLVPRTCSQRRGKGHELILLNDGQSAAQSLSAVLVLPDKLRTRQEGGDSEAIYKNKGSHARVHKFKNNSHGLRWKEVGTAAYIVVIPAL